LKKGQIRLTPKKDVAVDLARLVQALEKDAGFEPVTEVALEMRGNLRRRNGKLVLEMPASGQSFFVAKAEGTKPPEQRPLTVIAALVKPRAADRIVIRQWKEAEANSPAQAPPQAPAPTATAELTIRGMT
jgi:hypothetical protein